MGELWAQEERQASWEVTVGSYPTPPHPPPRPQPPRPGPWRSQGRSYWNLDRGWSGVKRTHGGVGSFAQVSGSPQHPSWEEPEKQYPIHSHPALPSISCWYFPRANPGGSSVGYTSRMQSRQGVGPERQRKKPTPTRGPKWGAW